MPEEPTDEVQAADSDRARDLDWIAAQVDAPADVMALAYDRNDGDIVNAIMELTEPVLRRRLEYQLAERQEEEEESESEAEAEAVIAPELTPEDVRRIEIEQLRRSTRKSIDSSRLKMPTVTQRRIPGP